MENKLLNYNTLKAISKCNRTHILLKQIPLPHSKVAVILATTRLVGTASAPNKLPLMGFENMLLSA